MRLIRYTTDEYREFEKLKLLFEDNSYDITQILEMVKQVNEPFPLLRNRLFGNQFRHEDSANQKEFIDGITNSRPIGKVMDLKQPKKYYLHLFSGDENGYVNYHTVKNCILIDNNHETTNMKTKFTYDDIVELAATFDESGFEIEDIQREKVNE